MPLPGAIGNARRTTSTASGALLWWAATWIGLPSLIHTSAGSAGGWASLQMLRERGPVLEGLELRFRERVVVGAVRHHPRTGFRLGGLGYERSAGSQFTVRLSPVRFGAGDFVVPPFGEIGSCELAKNPD